MDKAYDLGASSPCSNNQLEYQITPNSKGWFTLKLFKEHHQGYLYKLDAKQCYDSKLHLRETIDSKIS